MEGLGSQSIGRGRWSIAMAAALGLLACGMFLVAEPAVAKGLIDTMKHDIFIVTGKNFDSQISTHRTNGVATVVFYKDDKPSKTFVDGEYNEFAKEMRGMVKVAGLDCEAWSQFCEKQDIKEFPSVKIYPPQPFAAIIFDGAKTKKDLVNAAVRHIQSSHVKTLNDAEKTVVDVFLTTNIAVPKVLLFSSKEKPPVLFNALSNAFHDRMSFGFVAQNNAELVKRFSVKKFPTLTVLKGDLAPGKTGEIYTGEMKFAPLHEFLNVRSETFVRGGGYASEETAEDIKPWLVQKVPEVTRASHQDVCFRQKALCVIYITKGGAPEEGEVSVLEKLAENYAPMDSPKFKFSWLDPSVENSFAELVGAEKSKASVVVFNPHKRLRYLKLSSDEEPTESNIVSVIDKILGGDARFVNVKGQKLPPFAARETAAPAEKETPAASAAKKTPAAPAGKETAATPAGKETPAAPAGKKTPAAPAGKETEL